MVTRQLLSPSLVLSTWQKNADASVVVDASLFENDQEKALSKAIEELELTGSASDKLAQLFALSPVIDAFFDNTMVMAEDEAVKKSTVWPFLQAL